MPRPAYDNIKTQKEPSSFYKDAALSLASWPKSEYEDPQEEYFYDQDRKELLKSHFTPLPLLSDFTMPKIHNPQPISKSATAL